MTIIILLLFVWPSIIQAAVPFPTWNKLLLTVYPWPVHMSATKSGKLPMTISSHFHLQPKWFCCREVIPSRGCTCVSILPQPIRIIFNSCSCIVAYWRVLDGTATSPWRWKAMVHDLEGMKPCLCQSCSLANHKAHSSESKYHPQVLSWK